MDAPGEVDSALEGADESADPRELHELSEAKPEVEASERGDEAVCAVLRRAGEDDIDAGGSDCGMDDWTVEEFA